MTLFMPPIQRKKQVPEKYNPDTYRVISEDAVSDHPKYRPLPYRASFEPPTPTPKPVNNNNAVDESDWYQSAWPVKNTRVLPQILPDHRANKPQTKACGFLDRNVRFLNEPICNVYTKPVQDQEKAWWPTRANPGELVIPPYAEDTNYRVDYNCRHGNRPSGSGRHTSHTGREAALGTVPVNYLRERDGSQRFYKEGLSYEHMYNSRIDPNYPIRGKRHGAFVWSKMDPISQKKFVEYYQKLEEEEKQQMAAQRNCTSPGSKSAAPFVARSASNNNNNNNNNKSGSCTPKRRSSSSSVVNVERSAKESAKESAKSVKLPEDPCPVPVPAETASVPPPCEPPAAAAVTVAAPEPSQPEPAPPAGESLSQPPPQPEP